MTIEQIGQFYLNLDDVGGTSIGIDSNNLSSVLKEAKDKYRYVFGHYSFGFNERNLDFLSCLPETEGIWFWDVELDSIDGVYTLSSLKRLGVFGKFPHIDFSQLSTLRKLICDYRKKDKGISTLDNLDVLHLWHTNPKEKEFSVVDFPNNIKELQINWANPVALEGMPVLKELKTLEFHYCRNLSFIDGIEDIAPNLERIVFNRVNKIKDFSPLNKMRCLKEAWVNDRELTNQVSRTPKNGASS